MQMQIQNCYLVVPLNCKSGWRITQELTPSCITSTYAWSLPTAKGQGVGIQKLPVEVWGITAWGSRMSRLGLWNHWLDLRNNRLRSQMSRLSLWNQELPVKELLLEVWGSGKFPIWVWEVTNSYLQFPGKSKAKNAGWVAVFPGSASASWREATFHSWMQMHIQKWLGLLS